MLALQWSWRSLFCIDKIPLLAYKLCVLLDTWFSARVETLLLMLPPNETKSQARKIPCLGQMEKKPQKLYMVLCKIIQWLLEARDFESQKNWEGKTLKIKLQVRKASKSISHLLMRFVTWISTPGGFFAYILHLFQQNIISLHSSSMHQHTGHWHFPVYQICTLIFCSNSHYPGLLCK